MKRPLLFAAAIALILCGTPRPVHAGTVVIAPNGNSNTEGASNTGFPFNTGNFSYRYQQVYNASDFGAITGPMLITQIAFRPDIGAHAFSATLPDIQINLSTTNKSDATITNNFATNVGVNDTVVYNRGALSLSSAFTGALNAPKDFDIIINLTTPFLYNPADGNLLMDVRNYGGGTTVQFDAALSFTDSTARVFGGGSIPTGANISTGQTLDTVGLVTKFNFESVAIVPEPASLTLCGLGAMTMAGYAWRRRKKATI